ncbi:MAG: YicC/YloC family endoribonuclease [Acidiferrobacteraceae bacterium]
MLTSMTGFARRSRPTRAGTVTCELRSVNHRYLEIGLRLPEAVRSLEGALRERLTRVLKRGKIECSLRFDGESPSDALTLNEALVRTLCRLGGELERNHGVAPLRAIDVLRWPGVFMQAPADDVELAAAVSELTDETLADLVEQRSREGAKLAAMLEARLVAIRPQITGIREILPSLLPEFRNRLRARMAEAAVELDPGRLEQEIALFAQRGDVSEELDRLSAHLQEIERLLTVAGPVGRQLDFMMQEVNREANTLGSKSSDMRLTAASVEIKVLAEQMREQIQNIE